jgi:hypothetical protein
MFLKAWKMSDDTVTIHDPKCGHRKPARTGRNAYTEIVADGKSEYLSKEAFAVEYWQLQELQVLDPFQGLNFMPCCDELQVREPKKAKAKAATPRVTGHRQWANKPVPQAMLQFSQWIAREFPEIAQIDPRLVMIASKAYGAFQKSDMRVRDDTAA